ncbi:MAG: hypothetical protein J6Z14_09665 [Prevotella sp.]|nr:hypothetical protein [Prevotella sp.]
MKLTKTAILLATAILTLVCTTTAFAGQTDEPVSKETKKEAKKMEKEGWKPLPLAKPIAEQLQRSADLRKERLSDHLPRYFIATGAAKAGSIDIAKTLATERAKQELAAQMNAEVNLLTDYYLNNMQGGETASNSSSTIETRVKTIQRVGKTTTLMEICRDAEGGNIEVKVSIALDKEAILKDQ